MTGAELARAVAADAEWWCGRRVSRRGAQAGRPRARQVRLRHGPARRRRGQGAGAGGGRGRRVAPGRPHEPLRHRRRGRPGFLRRTAGPVHGAGGRAEAGATRGARHTANSAATLREPHAHFDMVRTGIAIYGLSPFQRRPVTDDLRPAMQLELVRRRRPRWCCPASRSATAGASSPSGRRASAIVPIGYADGVCRALTNRGDVLIAGRRCRISGTISMDQLTVLLPDDAARRATRSCSSASPAASASSARRWRGCSSTINYEIVCDVAPRVVRRYVGAAPRPRRRAVPQAAQRIERSLVAACSLARARRPGWSAAPARRAARPAGATSTSPCAATPSRFARALADRLGGAVLRLLGAFLDLPRGRSPAAASTRAAARREPRGGPARPRLHRRRARRPLGTAASVVDPLGGARRPAGAPPAPALAAALAADPLRVLRLARLAHAFELRRRTPGPWRRRTAAPPGCGRERRARGARALGAPRLPAARPRCATSTAWGALRCPARGRRLCKGVEQNPYHHLDVFEHTLEALEH